MSTYTLNTSLQNAYLTQVVNVDKNSFMFLGITKENVFVELCKVDDAAGQINCNVAYQAKLMNSDPVTVVAGKQRKSG